MNHTESQKIIILQGDAAIYILRSAFGVNWSRDIRIIFAGDDLTDEDAMKALKGLAYNFRVVNSGLVQTMADHRYPDIIFFGKIYFLYFPPRVHNLFDCPQVAGFYIKCTAFQTARHQRCANHAALVGALHVKSKKQMKPTTFKKLHLF